MSFAAAWLRGVWLGRALLLLMAVLFGLGLWLWAGDADESASGHLTPATATVVSLHSSPPAPKAAVALRMARLRLPDGREGTVAVPPNCAPQSGATVSSSLAQGARTDIRVHWPEHCAP